jgi:restriction endonuclease
MAFTSDPVNSITDRVRLVTGDTDPVYEFLDDETYGYVLDKNNNNEKQAALEAAKYILASITRFTRERTGDIEVYGNEFFKNYRTYLLELVNNPNFSTIFPMPYAGGISKKDMLANDENLDNVRPTVAYRGFSVEKHVYEEIQYDGPFEI